MRMPFCILGALAALSLVACEDERAAPATPKKDAPAPADEAPSKPSNADGDGEGDGEGADEEAPKPAEDGSEVDNSKRTRTAGANRDRSEPADRAHPATTPKETRYS